MKSDFWQVGQAMSMHRMPPIKAQASAKDEKTAKIHDEDRPNALSTNGTPHMIANIAMTVQTMWRRAVKYTLSGFSSFMAA
tara:strand:+ start:492 stop:734 length:243 start_codon:yes stop_codon:yes gene_type:complete